MKVWQLLLCCTRVPLIQRFFSPLIIFPGEQSKMPHQGEFDFYAVEKVEENLGDTPISTKSQPLFPAPPKAVSCVICGTVFECKARSTANACSEGCRRERRLRYGAKYRQFGRDGRAKVRAVFGGRDPTEGEILDFIKQRRNKP